MPVHALSNTTLHCYQGATFNQPIGWFSYNNVPVNLMDCTLRMIVRKNNTAETAIFHLDNSGRGGITIADLGYFIVYISDIDTAALELETEYSTTTPPSEAWWYDLEIERADGTVIPLMQGPFIVWARPKYT